MPYLALVVSGGHTSLFVVEDFGRYRRLGSTRDDAAGEAFDKVAKLMGLGYPGGKIIDDISKRGNRKTVKIPRARLKNSAMDFSFSGVKTAVANFLRSEAGAATSGEDLAASFQEAVVDMLIRPTIAAAHATGADTVALTGGVAANSRLRERLGAGSGSREPACRRASAPILHGQRRDDRDGGKLSPPARRKRSARPRCRGEPFALTVRRARNRTAEHPTKVPDSSRARTILSAAGLTPSKSKGQNFLTQGAIADRIVAAAASQLIRRCDRDRSGSGHPDRAHPAA